MKTTKRNSLTGKKYKVISVKKINKPRPPTLEEIDKHAEKILEFYKGLSEQIISNHNKSAITYKVIISSGSVNTAIMAGKINTPTTKPKQDNKKSLRNKIA